MALFNYNIEIFLKR